jgi:hypothetical protein
MENYCRHGFIFNDKNCQNSLCIDCIVASEMAYRNDVINTKDMELDIYAIHVLFNAVNPYDYRK